MLFSNNCSESCVLLEDGDIIVPVITIDSIKEINDVTTNKVSTNGFDLDALRGTEKTICKYKPQIASYTSGDQLWTITLYLRSIVPEYKIYYRHYEVGKQAMICYDRCE